MKKLFILLACAATMVACSKDEALEVNKGQKIAFGNPFVSKVTKADVPTYGVNKNLTEFKVWGTVTGVQDADRIEPIYAGTTVRGTVGGGNWTAEGETQYWAEGAAYNFAAIADGTAATVVDGLPATISYTRASQDDLLYAEAEVASASATQDPVNFQFSHLLSKVKFTVTTDIAAEGYYHDVSCIQVDNFKTGTYTVATGTWDTGTDDANKDDVDFGIITVDEDTPSVSNDAVLLIPNADDFIVSFIVEFRKGSTVIWSQSYSKTISQDLVKGHGYNFTIGLSAGNQIKFTVDDDPTAWIENDPATTPVHP